MCVFMCEKQNMNKEHFNKLPAKEQILQYSESSKSTLSFRYQIKESNRAIPTEFWGENDAV